ncbi:MAG: protein NO VEIN domain-containing protein [Gemmatimonadaceae bacterium]
MLALELEGRRYNKAEHNRLLQRRLPARRRQAIEFKHANVSAVLIELGLRYVDGYKPRANIQEMLREVVSARVLTQPKLAERMVEAADRMASPAVAGSPALKLVAVPKFEAPRARVLEHRVRLPASRPADYVRREAANRSLGLAGERAVLAFEHHRLWTAGRRKLADLVEHVAHTQGDGLGYDIHSFEENGADRLIEVKTTRGGEFMPFFVTRNEYDTSTQHDALYHLYRVFDFDRERRLFTLRGALQGTCALEPEVYRGRAR